VKEDRLKLLDRLCRRLYVLVYNRLRPRRRLSTAPGVRAISRSAASGYCVWFHWFVEVLLLHLTPVVRGISHSKTSSFSDFCVVCISVTSTRSLHGAVCKEKVEKCKQKACVCVSARARVCVCIIYTHTKNKLTKNYKVPPIYRYPFVTKPSWARSPETFKIK
jgi:hypothetical protein